MLAKFKFSLLPSDWALNPAFQILFEIINEQYQWVQVTCRHVNIFQAIH